MAGVFFMLGPVTVGGTGEAAKPAVQLTAARAVTQLTEAEDVTQLTAPRDTTQISNTEPLQ